MSLLNTVVQSAALSVFSNILAQLIDSYQKNTSLTNIDITTVLQFVTYAVLNTPINYLWQDWLELAFPSTKPAAAEKPTTSNTKSNTSSVRSAEKEQVLDVKNTIYKFLLDQTVGAAFNIPLFIGTIGMLKGQSSDQILANIQRDSLNIYVSGAKLWPAVSFISFTFIPPRRRVIFGSIAGVIWNIYLSLMAR